MEEKNRTGNVTDLWHSGYRYALSLTHNRSAAEDIIQDAWLAVLNAKGPENRAYLFNAVRTRFLNANKREQLISIVPLNEEAIQAELDGFSYQPDISCHLEHAILDKGMSELRSVEREALYLMTVEGYTANEVSTFTQQPRSTVLSHIHRAKKKLKYYIETHYKEVALGR